MTLPNTWDVVVEKGKTFRWWFAVDYPDDEVADLVADGYPHARFVVTTDWDDAPIIDINETNGIHIERLYDAPPNDPDRELWSGYLYVSAAATKLLNPWGVGSCELIVHNGSGDVITVIKGTAVLEPGATL